jgi:N-acetylneuraminic acid mutarotase
MPWKIKPSMKQPRAHFAAAAQGGKIYLMGGIGPANEPLASVEIYDPKTGESLEGPPLSAPRSHFSALMLQERIFALGGKGRKADGSAEPLKTVEIFNPATRTWERGPDLLFAHAGGGATVWRGIIYVVGGEHPEGTDRNNPGIGFGERWDPLRKKWFEIPPMPTPRFDFAAVGFNNRVIVMGGKVRQGGRETLFEKAEAFETAQKIWEDYPLTKLPLPMAGVGVCSMANLFIVGGAAEEGIVDQIHSVDQLQKRWIRMDPLPEPRAFGAVLTNVAQLDNSIYVLGGRSANGEPVNTVFAYST